MKNKILITIIITLLSVTSLYAQSSAISDEWEASPQYKEYIKFMEAGDLSSAMKIKKQKTDAITLRVMKPYLSHFKEKYRQKYGEKLCALPFELVEILNASFFKSQDILKLSDEKERNKLAKHFYDFVYFYNLESGKALKYANRITKSFPKLKNQKMMDILISMGKASDIEANKSPEQKQKEYDDFIANENRKQANENRKQEIWKKISEMMNSI